MASKKITAVIQARLISSRFKNKILKKVNGID
jgi:spore coat polysaccharide biosynthesis protein SpsF (cytidylyltransferase family)